MKCQKGCWPNGSGVGLRSRRFQVRVLGSSYFACTLLILSQRVSVSMPISQFSKCAETRDRAGDLQILNQNIDTSLAHFFWPGGFLEEFAKTWTIQWAMCRILKQFGYGKLAISQHPIAVTWGEPGLSQPRLDILTIRRCGLCILW